jgi:uncharacterized protein (UPF0332 family)
MDPHDFLDVADELSRGAREADWRSAVSRAYYAAFQVARALLVEQGFQVPQDDRAHAYLWMGLANSGHPDIQHAGNRLTYLRGRRNWADYDLGRPVDEILAAQEVLNAADIIQTLEALRTVPAALARVTTAIRDYERNVLRQVTWQQP